MQLKSSPFKIIVRTNMPRTEIIGFDLVRDSYKMNVHAHPERGKANIEIIRFFKKELKKDIKIISGITSKQKLIKIL